MKAKITHTNKGLQALMMLFFISFSSVHLFSQTQTPNTLPATGDVGVGTTAPSAKLEVVGDTKLGGRLDIDSSVVVRDSVTIEKKLIVDQDVLIKGTSIFVGDGKFKADLKVLGVGRMKDKLIIDSTVVMNSDAKIFGDLKIKSLEDPLLTTNRLVSINPNGKLIISSLKLAPNNPGCNYITPWTLGQNNDILLCPIFTSVNIGGNFSVDGTSHLAYLGVGIGNATPVTTLDVAGKITMRTGATAGYLPVSDANGTMTWKDPSTVGTGSVWQHNLSDIYFSTGNVGIGTTKTTDITGNVFMLSVAGDVRAESVEVSLETSWPDYILAKDYPLSSLQVVENYITKHHHLPNVPSEKEVKEKGINLGEMDAILLRKIEELTLYVIEQQKKIEELQNQLGN